MVQRKRKLPYDNANAFAEFTTVTSCFDVAEFLPLRKLVMEVVFLTYENRRAEAEELLSQLGNSLTKTEGYHCLRRSVERDPSVVMSWDCSSINVMIPTPLIARMKGAKLSTEMRYGWILNTAKRIDGLSREGHVVAFDNDNVSYSEIRSIVETLIRADFTRGIDGKTARYFPEFRGILKCEYELDECCVTATLESTVRSAKDALLRKIARTRTRLAAIEQREWNELQKSIERLARLREAVSTERDRFEQTIAEENALRDRNNGLLTSYAVAKSNSDTLVELLLSSMESRVNDLVETADAHRNAELQKVRRELADIEEKCKRTEEMVARRLRIWDPSSYDDSSNALDRLNRLREQCASATGILLTTSNDPYYLHGIAENCPVLRTPRTKDLVRAYDELSAELEKYDTLSRAKINKDRLSTMKAYSVRLYNITRWLECLRMSTYNSCTDEIARKTYSSIGQVDDHTLPSSALKKKVPFGMMNPARKNLRALIYDQTPRAKNNFAERAFVGATSFESTELASDDTIPKYGAESIATILMDSQCRITGEGNDRTRRILDTVLFPGAHTFPEPEWKGLAFAVLAASRSEPSVASPTTAELTEARTKSPTDIVHRMEK